MNQIIQNPGLQHITENIFLNLDFDDLLSCQLINESCNELLKNPMFWLKKWSLRGLSKKNEADWVKAIQMTRNTNFEKNLLLYIKKVIKFGHFVDVPCYIDANVLKRSTQFTIAKAYKQRHAGILQLLVALTKDCITDINGCPPISLAARDGSLEVIKVLSPLMEDPNLNVFPICSALLNTIRQEKGTT